MFSRYRTGEELSLKDGGNVSTTITARAGNERLHVARGPRPVLPALPPLGISALSDNLLHD